MTSWFNRNSNNKFKLNRLDQKLLTTATVATPTTTTTTSSIVDSLLKQAKLLNNNLKIKQQISSSQNTTVKPAVVKSPKTKIASHSFKKTTFSINNRTIIRNKKLDVNLILGRRVSNLSRNKFKFIKRNSISNPNNNNSRRFKRRILPKNPYSLRAVPVTITSQNIVQIKGVKYNINRNGKKLKRLNSPRASLTNAYKLNNLGGNKKVKQTDKIVRNLLATNLVQRSICRINRTSRQTKQDKSLKGYCRFYNLFGRCTRGDACKFVHDPKRVTICQRFLRGLCTVDKCPFSHSVEQEKIPLCSFYAAGCCVNDKCPYLHVFHGKNATFCEEFARGFCKNGQKCDKAHLTICPDFLKDGKCKRNTKCPLLHRKSKKLVKSRSAQLGANNSLLITFDTNPQDDPFSTQQAFISIQTNNKDDISKEPCENLINTESPGCVEVKPTVLKIRPNFNRPKPF